MRNARRGLAAAGVLLVAALVVAGPPGAAAGPPHLGAPQVVSRDDVGDPFVLPVPAGPTGPGRYVVLWTTDWQSNVPEAVSTDLVHWRRGPDALPVLPAWATASRTLTWAPSALAVAGGWVLYFSTQEAASGRECLGRAFATDPAGPYADRSAAPLVCQRDLGGDIDPSVTRDAAGRPVLAWKSDGNAVGVPTALWSQPLTPDGLAVVDRPHRLLTADEPWEHGIVEGPALLRDPHGGWRLFYSAGSWQSGTYSTGVATCAGPTGPCSERLRRPLLGSTASAVSPGGLETFVDLQGRLRASYSVFERLPGTPDEAMREDRVLAIATLRL